MDIKHNSKIQILANIGLGSWGQVQKVILFILNKKENKTVAAKTDPVNLEDELKIVKGLRHSNISEYVGYFVNQNETKKMLLTTLYTTNVYQLFKTDDPKPFDYVLLGFQLFRALFYLSTQKVLQNDLTKTNMLLSEKGECCLCDFGSACTYTEKYVTTTKRGSDNVTSPEGLFRGRLNETSDCWGALISLCSLQIKEKNTTILGKNTNTAKTKEEIKQMIGEPSESEKDKMKTIDTFPAIPRNPAKRVEEKLKLIKCDPVREKILAVAEKVLVYDIEKRFSPLEVLKSDLFDTKTYPQEVITQLTAPLNLYKKILESEESSGITDQKEKECVSKFLGK